MSGSGEPSGRRWTRPSLYISGRAAISGRIALSWAAPEPGLLVVSERYDPGWRARSGGRRLPVVAAGGVLLGVELGPGEGELELVYRPAGIGWGAAAGAAAVAVMLALWVARRRGSPAPTEEPA